MQKGNLSRDAALQRRIAICLEVLINLIYLAIVSIPKDTPAHRYLLLAEERARELVQLLIRPQKSQRQMSTGKDIS
jgi:hypothetical protein